MNLKKSSDFLLLIFATVLLSACERPVLNVINPNTVVPRQIVAIEGDKLGLAAVVWNAGQPGHKVANSSFIESNYFQIPEDATPGSYPVQLSSYGGVSNNIVNVTVRALSGSWPPPRIEDITYRVISSDAGTNKVKVALYLTVANVDAKAQVIVNNAVRNSWLYSAIPSNYFASHIAATYNYPVYHYGQLIIGMDTVFGSHLNVEVRNIDGLRGAYSLDLPADLNSVDSDNDGLLDQWETSGYTVGSTNIDLQAMGCDPYRKDILVEADWMTGRNPSDGIWQRIENVFRLAPVMNPDGSQGIHLHIDKNHSDPIFANAAGSSGGQSIPYHETIGFEPHSNAVDFVSFNDIKNDPAYFDPARRAIFHYCIFGFAETGGSSGSSEIWGSDLYVTLGRVHDQICDEPLDPDTETAAAGTFIHELGHNLGLYHGGIANVPDQEETYKPNQPSSMNYRYQWPGVSTNCDMNPDGFITFSEGMLKFIDEQHVSEQIGICDNMQLELNCNRHLNTTVRPINVNPGPSDDDDTDILIDYDEWGNIKLNFRLSPTWQSN